MKDGIYYNHSINPDTLARVFICNAEITPSGHSAMCEVSLLRRTDGKLVKDDPLDEIPIVIEDMALLVECHSLELARIMVEYL